MDIPLLVVRGLTAQPKKQKRKEKKSERWLVQTSNFEASLIMAASSLLIVGSGCIIPSTPRHSFFTQPSSSSSVLQWHLIGKPHTRLHMPMRGHAFRLLADPNVSSGSRSFKREVLMVEPLEAKKLAMKQFEEIKAKEKYQRRRKVEAINGAWAMIGLTAGLVLEGQTGKGILGQLDGYWHAILSFFFRW